MGSPATPLSRRPLSRSYFRPEGGRVRPSARPLFREDAFSPALSSSAARRFASWACLWDSRAAVNSRFSRVKYLCRWRTRISISRRCRQSLVESQLKSTRRRRYEYSIRNSARADLGIFSSLNGAVTVHSSSLFEFPLSASEYAHGDAAGALGGK